MLGEHGADRSENRLTGKGAVSGRRQRLLSVSGQGGRRAGTEQLGSDIIFWLL